MFRNLKLRSKLATGFILVLLLCTFVCWVGLSYLNEVADNTRLMYEQPYTVHTSILRIQRNIAAMGREMKEVLVITDSSDLELIQAKIDELEQEVYDEFELLYEQFTGDHAILDSALEAFSEWKPVREEVVRLMGLGIIYHANVASEEREKPLLDHIEARIQEIVELAEQSAWDFAEDAANNAAYARSMVLGFLAAAYIVAFIVATATTRSITKPVGQLLAFTQEITQGNLAVADVDYESKDEIGVLSNALNQMKQSLRSMAASVTASVATASSSSEQMAVTAQETSASVEELASTANQFAAAVDRLSVGAQNMAASAQRTSELSGQGKVEIDRTVDTMADIAEQVGLLAGEIRNLGRHSDQIGEIVDLITGIADQTNLLALNAAIEAARAGEQGRGFAVVADEVRQLAEQSAAAAREITELVHKIRDAAQNSVQNADQTAAKVNEGRDIANHSGQMFEDINGVIQNLAEEIDEIARAAEDLATGAEEIGATIEEQSASTQQMAASAAGVSAATSQVEEEMNRFKL